MSIFKCKMCGGTIEFEQGATVGVCDSCGTKQTLPRLDDDRRANLYDRANHFRRNNEFDKAAAIYEQILTEDTTDAEAYWSLVLCQYGIEYVEDPATHKRVPTVNRAQFTSIFDDDNYKSAIQYADGYQRELYEKEAKTINDIQKGILAISQKEEPFDVFICYKETDNNGRRTPDSVLANDLYYQLKQEGFKVFFARITLEDKLGTAYEPYIFAALNSSKVMVVLGTKPEHFNAVWVKNEWSRYLSLVKKSGGKKILIPAYKDMDPYDLPEEFSHLQAQDMSKLGFMQDLIRGIKKVTQQSSEPKTAVKETVVINGNTNVAPLLKRAFMFLEDGNWEEADAYCEKVLDLDPENARAYAGKLMVEFKTRRESDLGKLDKLLEKSTNYTKVLRYADSDMKAKYTEYNSLCKDNMYAGNFAKENLIISDNVMLGLKNNGEVLYCSLIKDKSNDLIDISRFKYIKSIALGSKHIVGLMYDGTVVADGDNSYGQCNVGDWNDIIQIKAGAYHTVGLRSDGTVLATGINANKQYNVSLWHDVISIEDFYSMIFGIKSDGTVVTTETISSVYNVSSWNNIKSIKMCNRRLFGIRNDGSVVSPDGMIEDEGWKDIVNVDLFLQGILLGLKSDGSIVFAVIPDYVGEELTESEKNTKMKVFGTPTKEIFSTWRDIVSIKCVGDLTAGLHSDGTVTVIDFDEYASSKLRSRYEIKTGWKNIVSIIGDGKSIYGICSDGTVVTTNDDETVKDTLKSWKLFNNIDTLAEELRTTRKKADTEIKEFKNKLIKQKEETYNEALELFKKCETAEDFDKSRELFAKAIPFKDSSALMDACIKNRDYIILLAEINDSSNLLMLIDAIKGFKHLGDFKESQKYVQICVDKIDEQINASLNDESKSDDLHHFTNLKRSVEHNLGDLEMAREYIEKCDEKIICIVKKSAEIIKAGAPQENVNVESVVMKKEESIRSLQMIYDSFDGIKSKISNIDAETGRIVQQTEQLNSRLSGLGIFAWKEKKQIRADIESLEMRKNALAQDKKGLVCKLQGFTSKAVIGEKIEAEKNTITSFQQQMENAKKAISQYRDTLEKYKTDSEFCEMIDKIDPEIKKHIHSFDY